MRSLDINGNTGAGVGHACAAADNPSDPPPAAEASTPNRSAKETEAQGGSQKVEATQHAGPKYNTNISL